MNTHPRIFVAGHNGMVGSAIVRQLLAQGVPRENIITKSHKQLDLTDQYAVRHLFQFEHIDQIYLAAAKVGGIYANNAYPAEFIYSNLMIETSVIQEAWRAGIHKLLFLGSSCIYPKHAQQPMAEEALLTGQLEPTNEPYAIAKIAGIKICESYNRQYGTDYRSVMPTNLYGPGDNYHLANSHVLPAMIRKFHLAKMSMEGDLAGIVANEQAHGEIPVDILQMLGLLRDDEGGELAFLRHPHSIQLWGTGTPYREFLYVDDMAKASIHVMNLDKAIYDTYTSPMLSHINVGYGSDFTIREMAEKVAKIVGYKGDIEFDATKPDGTPRKLMDSTRLRNMGWLPEVDLEAGVRMAFEAYLAESSVT
ncbi:GDP-L-fucose synthase family protein [Uliginosibacterium aquaticum]|uniref:GDP-L-fucose synthase n=1 Tax=Uliginosibacterium aquaticum TaxID=2731212 RepID=A0ABX2IGA0_9RHOO|nr:GDP-L-fucose synthase [Uliginosibacterium aquaticum]NSL54027.1 GDP-L-fucose synthase [Uliginosibacterium aquaticum]